MTYITRNIDPMKLTIMDEIDEELANYDLAILKTYSPRKFSNHVKKLLPNVENPSDLDIIVALIKVYGTKSMVGTCQRFDRLVQQKKLIPQKHTGANQLISDEKKLNECLDLYLT